MAEQVIDIRKRIEKMRIKFEDDQQNFVDKIPNDINELDIVKKIENKKTLKNDDFEKDELFKSNENNELPSKEILKNNNKDFPSVQLSVKNPISSKILVILMLLQVFSNIGIFMLLLNVLE